MRKDTVINRTLKTLEQLPEEKIKEINDFADFILNKYDEEILQKGLEKLVSESKSFEFLKDEEELYSSEDLKEKY